VAHVGEKLALQPGSLFGMFLGKIQLSDLMPKMGFGCFAYANVADRCCYQDSLGAFERT